MSRKEIYKLFTSPEEIRKHELAHYGVLGMKWGVRRDLGPDGLVKGGSTAKAHGQPKVKGNIVMELLSIAVPVAIWFGLGKLAQHEEKKAWQASIDRVEKPGRDIPTLAALPPGKQPQPQSVEADSEAVNPHVFEDSNYQTNCTNCAAAYEVRRRGFNVKALPRPDGRGMAAVRNMYKRSRLETAAPPNNVDSVKKLVSAWGANARGSIVTTDKFDNAHIFSVEITNGKILFVDSQVNGVSDNGKFSIKFPDGHVQHGDSIGNSRKTQLFRTDNLELNTPILEGIGNDKRD